MDVFTAQKRSWLMSRIHGKNTKPEKAARSLLHQMGYRFRLHDSKLPGKPDIVLPKYKTALFVHGCFWHRHVGCKYAYTPKSRVEFWQQKFDQNVKRDQAKHKQLEDLGWRVQVLWECELRQAPTDTIERLVSQLGMLLPDSK